MNRRAALLAGCSLLMPGAAYAHIIAGGRCSSPNCAMCNHRRAHEKGLQHDANGWYNPRTRKRSPDTKELVKPERGATPQTVVDAMLAVIKPTPEDTLIDPGCGDGRFLISAARDYGCMCVGNEIDREMAMKARNRVCETGVSDLVVIRNVDSRRDPLLSGATLVVMYLYDKLIRELWPKFENARSVASYQHKLPVTKQTRYTMRNNVFYVSDK